MMLRLASGVALGLIALSASAHEGALDSFGCHPNVAHGSYHCHDGLLRGQGYASKEMMLRAYQERQQEERVRARAANPPPGETLSPTTPR